MEKGGLFEHPEYTELVSSEVHSYPPNGIKIIFFFAGPISQERFHRMINTDTAVRHVFLSESKKRDWVKADDDVFTKNLRVSMTNRERGTEWHLAVEERK